MILCKINLFKHAKFNHFPFPMLRDFTPRLYQQTILGTTARYNTLVVLPTGLGKTGIALLTTAQRLQQYPSSKILFLAPTKPLCEQHVETLQKHLNIPPEKIVLFTGEVAPEKRAVLWKDAQIIISTPQGLENDTINQRVNLQEVSLLILDEAHHATGEYSYVWLAQQYDKLSSYSRILALTASPGSDLEKIKEICQNLLIEKVEVRTEKDPDVRPYVQTLNKRWITVDFPEPFQKIQKQLQDCQKNKLAEMQHLGYCRSTGMMKGELLALQGELQGKISEGQRNMEILRSISLLAEALKVEHALELLETQGLRPLGEYFAKLQGESVTSKVKAVKNLFLDSQFLLAIHLTDELLQQNVKHPKIPKLLELVKEELSHNSLAKMIIFTQFRDSAQDIVREFSLAGISNQVFVGQAKKKGVGFSQKQQKEILERFRGGKFTALVATSVAEEGLDIPKVDSVIFYEPVPSAIRAIQRRGRTGRLEKGEVTLLITKGTRDEAYRWSSHHKEKQMYRNLETIRSQFSSMHLEKQELQGLVSKTSPQQLLDQFVPESSQTVSPQTASSGAMVAIVADHREKDNKVVKELIELGISVRTAQLTIADYIISGKVAVELKKVPDFVDSLIDHRLLEQVRQLKQHFDKAVIIIEGEEDMYSLRKVHANALRGLLATIVLDFGVPVLTTKDYRDTAALLAVMAKREQNRGGDFSYHERKPHTLQEQQEFLVSSLPGIGMVTARTLLARFGSIKALVNASSEELMALEGVGEKMAQRLKEMWEKEYEHKKRIL